MNNFKILKISILLTLLFFTYIFLSAKSYSTYLFDDITENTFRLHIVANSNSSEDQYLKLKIRDAILNYVNSSFLISSSNLSSKQELIDFLNSNYDELSSIINNTIIQNGYDYKFSITIENCYFPTKTYDSITFPMGNYDCLNIKIGEALGENWWCALFPFSSFDESSIIIDSASELNSSKVLSDESKALLTSDNVNFKIKFKILEIFNSL